MKHRVAGRKLGRTSEHRLALLRNLATSLFERERITTTLPKAKELRRFAEKLVTLSKRETLHARRRVLRHVRRRDVVAKLFDTLSARYATRPGGYTRVIRLGPRRGDNAEMALIELVGAETAPAPPEKKAKEGKTPAKEPAEAAAKTAAKPAGRGRKATPAAAAEERSRRKAQSKGESGAQTTARKSKAGAAPAARRKSTRSKREGG